IGIFFDPEDPFATNSLSVGGKFNQRPSVVMYECIIFCLHSSMPLRMKESLLDIFGLREWPWMV
ncbi:hypothetical protein A2U01_0071679, partial [Trifolium medium]|nr:hypothetical protein [Trifolium medium]